MSSDDCQDLRYVQYDSCKEEVYLEAIRQIISKDLSEPYSIYVYRYFLYQWGDLCFMVSPAWALYAHNLLTPGALVGFGQG
jgi:peptide alpha-N-acetyltransferase